MRCKDVNKQKPHTVPRRQLQAAIVEGDVEVCKETNTGPQCEPGNPSTPEPWGSVRDPRCNPVCPRQTKRSMLWSLWKQARQFKNWSWKSCKTQRLLFFSKRVKDIIDSHPRIPVFTAAQLSLGSSLSVHPPVRGEGRCVSHSGVLLCHKKDNLESGVEKWMGFETIIVSEINQTRELKHHMVCLVREAQSVNNAKRKIVIVRNRATDPLQRGRESRDRGVDRRGRGRRQN